jgi:hypothetical protein
MRTTAHCSISLISISGGTTSALTGDSGVPAGCGAAPTITKAERDFAKVLLLLLVLQVLSRATLLLLEQQ